MENKTVTKTEKKTWLEWSSEKSGVDADTIQLLYHAGIIPVEATRQPAQIALFFKTQHALGLNPILKKAHMLPFKVRNKDNGQWETHFATVVGIDAVRQKADETGSYAGQGDVTFDNGMTLDECVQKGLKHPRTARSVIKRVVAGLVVEFVHSVRWEAFARIKRDGTFMDKWASMPFHMLAKCAEAGAFRKAFPAALGGVYIEEEFHHMSQEPPQEADFEEIPADAKTLDEALAEINDAGPEDMQRIWDENPHLHGNERFEDEWGNKDELLKQTEQ